MWPKREIALSVLARLARKPHCCATKLRWFYEECPGAALSVPELAEALFYTERTVFAALAEMRRYPEFTLVEEEVEVSLYVPYGCVPMRRWIVYPPPSTEDQGGLQARSPSPSWTADPVTDQGEPRETSHVDLSLHQDLSLERQIGEISTPPGGSTRRRTCTRERARDARALSRKDLRRAERRQQRQDRLPSPTRRAAPVAIEAGVWRALSERYGGHAVTVLRRELRLEKYHQHPEEAGRALRTLLERTPQDGVLQALRGFFKLALRGEALVDRQAWVEATLGAEADALAADLPIDFDIAALRAELKAKGQNMSADAIVAHAWAHVRANPSKPHAFLVQLMPGVFGPKPREPRPEELELERILGHLKTLPDNHPARPQLQEDALRMVARGIKPPDRSARVAPAPSPGRRDGGDPWS